MILHARPFLADFLIGYLTLFSIINPFGVSFVFLSMTRRLDDAARRAVSRRIGLYSFVILIGSLFVGSWVMRFFGIGLPALRIAGGLVVAMSGWSMLSAPEEAEATHPAHID
ncbi:MAG TPA: MarC family protein, partial [Alphaproteobacteria bacterium]|nr:MarC family protein [Alphaproteobacteria bacterium]